MDLSCLNCVLKHIGQAAALMDESLLGYPTHRWRAVGHMAEAERECLPDHLELAINIRGERLAYIADPDYRVGIDELIKEADERMRSDKLPPPDRA